uniref:Mitochondrial resolvase Ydc2 catalytic domain-containing protein n=1 Tax=viral metagenome TaxID=1070528 RepID=A0A6C0LDD2_9ZZZZ
MRLLSIDVGIKNLAYCLLTTSGTEFTIDKWGVLDLSEEISCLCSIMEKGVPCGKPAKFKKDSHYFCLKHSKKQVYQVPANDLKPAFINKQKIQNLCEIADKYKIAYEKPIKKTDLTNIINTYILETCFEPVVKINASKLDLVTIGHNLQIKFDEVLENQFHTIDMVIIENQIGPIAIRMKTIQGMIAQYFIMRNYQINIDFVNASNKLKALPTTEKTSYKDRKKLGIQTCADIFSSNTKLESWKSYFENHKKKDDLADALLQGLWFISTVK